ncbi:MAG: HAMP domain-containing sensor histidine kinase [Polyangiales bacterium]|nr:HAMP domain-containing histidine kinase [Myxococcales bacterium]
MRIGGWVTAAIAALPFVLPVLYTAARIPPKNREALVTIADGWTACATEPVGGPGGTWSCSSETFSLPAQVAKAPGPGVVWLRTSVTLPKALENEPLALHLGESRTPITTVYFNGHLVGRELTAAHGIKVPPIQSVHVLIPAEFAHPGTNVIDVRVDYLVAADTFFGGSNVVLGAERILAPFFVALDSVEIWLPLESTYLSMIFIAILIALWVLDARLKATDVRRYPAAILTLASITVFVWMTKSTNLAQLLPTRTWVFAVNRIAIGACVVFSVRFSTVFWVDTPGPWTKRFLLGLQGLLGACALVVGYYAASDNPEGIYSVYDTCAPAFMLGLAGATLVGVMRLVRGDRREFGVVVVSSLIALWIAGAHDLARGSRWSGPALFPITIILLGIVQGVVSLVHFLQVAVRNTELAASLSQTNFDLRNALDNAEQARRMKAGFLANVSHELRTPLNAIVHLPSAIMKQFAAEDAVWCNACKAEFELDAGETLPPNSACPSCGGKGSLVAGGRQRFTGDAAAVRADLALVERSSAHLLSVIDDILDINRLEARATTLNRSIVDATVVGHRAVDVVRALAAAQEVRLSADIPAKGTVMLDADETRLAQILVNLLSNAIKFSPEGRRVELKLVAEGGDAVFSVRDEGIGIAPSHHDLIFESFRQIETGQKRAIKGSGLGLAITKHLVVMHGGSISVASDIGKGSTFTVRIPLSDRATDTP